MTTNNSLEEFEKNSAQLLHDIASDKPIECSQEVRELARQVVAEQEEELKHPLTDKQIQQWARNLVKSIYGEK